MVVGEGITEESEIILGMGREISSLWQRADNSQLRLNQAWILWHLNCKIYHLLSYFLLTHQNLHFVQHFVQNIDPWPNHPQSPASIQVQFMTMIINKAMVLVNLRPTFEHSTEDYFPCSVTSRPFRASANRWKMWQFWVHWPLSLPCCCVTRH